MDNNYLFLAMAAGGQLTPEMLQRAQQMGQLPQLGMGAGLNDIQKMNMRQQEHYGNSMFRYGGVPYKADGGEQQESVDQEYLSPYKKYNGRIQDFLQQLKTKSMNAVQDEMINTANDYDQEAATIDAENQMRYGGNYADGGEPMFDQSGLDAVNAWQQASQNNVNLTNRVAGTAALASGLGGYFNKAGENFANNPFNTQYVKKATTTDLLTGDKSRIRFDTGGGSPVSLPRAMTPEQFAENARLEANAKAMGWVNADGTADVAGYSAPNAQGVQTWGYKPGFDPNAKAKLPTSSKTKKEKTPKLTPEEEAAAKAKAEQDARIAEETKKAAEEKKKKEEEAKGKEGEKKEETKTETKTEDKTTKDVGDGLDPWRALADPNSTQAGAYYQLDKKGNKIPMAFYDPNMRITSESAEYSHPIGNLFRSPENKKSGMMKKATYTFGTLDNATQVPNIQMPANAPAAPAAVPNQTAKFFPKNPAADKVTGPGYAGGPWKPELMGPGTDAAGWGRSPELDKMHRDEFANWHPGMVIPQAPPSMHLALGPNNFSSPPAPAAQVPQGPLTPKDIRQQGKANRQTAVQQANEAAQRAIQDAIANQNAGTHKYGGDLRRFVPGGPTSGNSDNVFGENSIGVAMDNPWAPAGPAAPQPTYGNGPLDKPMEMGKIYQQPGVKETNQIDYKFGKHNPFFAPAMMAGLNTVAGALGNKESEKNRREMMNKLSGDQAYTTMNQSSGSRGDHAPNLGIIRPNDYVPTQFQGYNFQSNYAAAGGEMNEGDEMYLDEDTINAILAAGGQIEYLD